MTLTFIGLVAGLIALFANLPYILDIIKGKTKPHRISWLIFLSVNLINLTNQSESGAANSLWLIAGFSVTQTVIVLLALKKGVGVKTILDLVCLCDAVIGLVLWLKYDSPVLSVSCNIAVATIVLVPTAVKAYKRPKTETRLTWLLGSIGALLAAVSVGTGNYLLLIWPLYSFVAQFCIYILLQRRLLLQPAPAHVATKRRK